MFIPSIVPIAEDTVYLVEDDYGHIGRSFRETDVTKSDRETTLQDLLSGQFNNPVRVIALNIREEWARDVSFELAVELQRRADSERRELTGTTRDFVVYYTRRAMT